MWVWPAVHTRPVSVARYGAGDTCELSLLYTASSVVAAAQHARTMDQDNVRWLLKGKLVKDFRGFPLGRVTKVWFESATGPLVIVERSGNKGHPMWEAIPLRQVHTVSDCVHLKPPVFAE